MSVPDDTRPTHAALRFTRRAAIGAMVAGGAGFALFGPRGAKEASGGRIVLDYWEKWTGHEGRAMQGVIDRFNDSQSRIFVRYLVTAGVDQKAMIAISGGNPPDVVGLYNYNVPGFAETGGILPLDGFDSALVPRQEQYAAGVWPILRHPDSSGVERTWAVPNTGGTLAMYYNRSAFREAGLDPDRPPRTIGELDEMSRKLDVIDGDGTIRRAGFLHTEPGWWSWVWGYHYGGRLYDRPSNTASFDAPQNLRAYEWLASTSARLGPPRVETFKSGFANAYSSALNGLLDGKVAMVMQGPWLANVIAAFKPDLDYAVAPVPVSDELLDPASPIGLVESDILVIPRGVRHPEASMEFIAYTQRQDVSETLARAHFKNSVMTQISAEFVRDHPNRGIGVHNAIAKSPRGFLAPRSRDWLQLKQILDDGVPQIWNHTIQAPTQLAAMNRQAQAVLDRSLDVTRRRHGAAPGKGVAR
ncbi:MAG: extracellular solute-binding protein [Planctomycetota bacterium]